MGSCFDNVKISFHVRICMYNLQNYAFSSVTLEACNYFLLVVYMEEMAEVVIVRKRIEKKEGNYQT